MRRTTSLYLDLVRVSAALVVFIGHVSGQRLTGGLGWQIAPFMGEAVAVFFVLSGFIIAYTLDTKERCARDFIIARLARVYSVALPALLLTFCLDTLGQRINPDLYASWWGFHTEHPLWQYLRNLVFVAQFEPWQIAPGSNGPFWSLNFEVWYYVLCGIALFLPRWGIVIAGVVVVVFHGTHIVGLLPLWCLGVLAYRASKLTGTRVLTLPLAGIPLVFWWVYQTTSLHQSYPITMMTGPDAPWALVPTYLFGLGIALHFIGVNAVLIQLRAAAPERIARAIRWVAGATFSLYLYHMPIAQFLTVIAPGKSSAWEHQVIVYGGTLIVVLVLAEFTERRKSFWRRVFTPGRYRSMMNPYAT